MEYPKLNPEFKAKWVAALRSEEYKQGTGVLHNIDDSFCCLGVAGDICGIPTYEMKSVGSFNENDFEDFDNYKLPKELIGYCSDNTLVRKLTQMNDGSLINNVSKHTFKEIADWIEEHL